MVCPAVWNWGNIWPRYDIAIVNISNLTRDGYEYGAKGMLNTEWVDEGESLFNDNWMLFAWGADVSWNTVKLSKTKDNDKLRNDRYQKFMENYDAVFYG